MDQSNDPTSGSSEPTVPANPNDQFENGEMPQRWDANDPRRQKDSFAPPTEPCECYCLHCNRVFSSEGMWLQRVIGGRDGFEGFWMCPTPNCDGKGFTFDIFPTDPAHPANAGWSFSDDEDDDQDYDEDAFDENGDYIKPEDRVYDPDEPKYQELDEDPLQAHDIEGEEWKFGLEPGETLPEPETESMKQARLEWEEEQKMYDLPDERPREIQYEEPPPPAKGDPQPPGEFKDNDIPF